MIIGRIIHCKDRCHNQYTIKKPVARTYYNEDGYQPGGRSQKESVTMEICTHHESKVLKQRFNWFARTYCIMHGHRTWMKDMKGNILYDTDRGDGLPEVALVRRTSLDKLPLLMARIKTRQGLSELEKRLKQNV